eukprot:9261207-Pyramimonas_sp.AAC.1
MPARAPAVGSVGGAPRRDPVAWWSWIPIVLEVHLVRGHYSRLLFVTRERETDRPGDIRASLILRTMLDKGGSFVFWGCPNGRRCPASKCLLRKRSWEDGSFIGSTMHEDKHVWRTGLFA